MSRLFFETIAENEIEKRGVVLLLLEVGIVIWLGHCPVAKDVLFCCICEISPGFGQAIHL